VLDKIRDNNTVHVKGGPVHPSFIFMALVYVLMFSMICFQYLPEWMQEQGYSFVWRFVCSTTLFILSNSFFFYITRGMCRYSFDFYEDKFLSEQVSSNARASELATKLIFARQQQESSSSIISHRLSKIFFSSKSVRKENWKEKVKRILRSSINSLNPLKPFNSEKSLILNVVSNPSNSSNNFVKDLRRNEMKMVKNYLLMKHEK
jgi:hypothetical protein